ncbi:MAG: EFR1 family ferrodoxin [Lachnospirales bacterium]
MEIFYYSSTGNSLYVSKSIGLDNCKYSPISEKLKNNDLSFTDDKIGIVLPCHGLTVPKDVLDFVQNVTFNTNYLFLIMVYGGSKGLGVSELVKVLEKKNIKVNYVNYIVMQDNFLPFFEMEKESKNYNDSLVEANISIVASDIANGIERLIGSKSSIYPILKPITSIARKYLNGNFDKGFYLDGICTSCEVCSKVCPRNNIEVLKAEKNIKFKSNCSACLSCIHNCPQNIIHLKSEKSSKRFRNKNIKLEELLKNNK